MSDVELRPPTLSQLLATLSPDVLQAACAPRGYEVPAGEPVVHGPGETMSVCQDGLLLLVGGRPGNPQAATAVREAGRFGYCAVVVKARGDDVRELAQEADASGVALLLASDDVTWRHLDALLTAATSATRSPAPHYDSVGIGDLFALADAIAATVGGAVTIEDPHGRVQAYSNLANQDTDDVRRLAILNRQTPERPQNTDEYRTVCQADGPVRIEVPKDSGSLDRLAVAVRVGSQVLGVIFALDGRPPLGPDAHAALEEAAKVTALHLLRRRNRGDTERWNRSEALRSLLDASVPGRTAAAQLGVDADTATVVLAVLPTGAHRPGVDSARIVDLVSLYCEAWHSRALCTTGGSVVYALLPVRRSDVDHGRLRKLADDIVVAVRRATRLRVYVGIGGLAPALDDVPESRRTADRVLRALVDHAGGLEVATAEDVRSRVVLLELADRGVADVGLPSAPVQRVLEHDAEHGTAYAGTLLAFLDAFGDAKQAAAVLSVHDNTLRYRIRRTRQLFGLDLSDPEERLVTWLQLRLHQLQDGAGH